MCLESVNNKRIMCANICQSMEKQLLLGELQGQEIADK